MHQRMDFVQGSTSTWMGRYSYADNEVTPALKLNGTKLDARVHQAMVGNTWTLSPTLLNEFRFGFNYFFNTFGRELAFERDVVKELGIPGISLNPPEAWGIPSIGITGFNGFGDSTEGPYTIDNRTFEFSDNLTWIRGRHAFKAGASFRCDMPTRWATSSPAATSSSRTLPPATPSAISCWATRSRPSPRWRWR